MDLFLDCVWVLPDDWMVGWLISWVVWMENRILCDSIVVLYIACVKDGLDVVGIFRICFGTWVAWRTAFGGLRTCLGKSLEIFRGFLRLLWTFFLRSWGPKGFSWGGEHWFLDRTVRMYGRCFGGPWKPWRVHRGMGSGDLGGHPWEDLGRFGFLIFKSTRIIKQIWWITKLNLQGSQHSSCQITA